MAPVSSSILMVLLGLEAKEALGTAKGSVLGDRLEVVEKEVMVLKKASIFLQEQETAKALRALPTLLLGASKLI